MPTYAFQCSNCDSAFETQLGFNDPQPTKCSSCGGTLKRQYGNLGVTFRGSGFYRTDSRSSDSSSSASAPASAASKSEGSSGSSN